MNGEGGGRKGAGKGALVLVLMLMFVIYSTASMYLLVTEGNLILDTAWSNFGLRLVFPITIAIAAWATFALEFRRSRANRVSSSTRKVYALGILALGWTMLYVVALFLMMVQAFSD